MPELPEVETVRKALKRKILNKKIINVEVFYPKVVEYPSVEEFKKVLIGRKIVDIKRYGKWLIFDLDGYYLLSHLRMEGKYIYRNKDDEIGKHEHVSILFDDNLDLRYRDVRKFGKMFLVKKDDLYTLTPLSKLGLEPWDKKLDSNYLKSKYKNKRLPIKTVLLDQSIITGIGNIYADEILFLSKINPHKITSEITEKEMESIIKNTRLVLEKAIEKGGTTIRSYTSEEGVTGLFQNDLLVHKRENEKCYKCGSIIKRDKINGRSSYYCPKCQIK